MSRSRPTAREVHLAPPSSRTAEEQAAYEERFFGLLRQRNGVFKTTWAHRFDAINAAVNRLLPPDRPLHLMDVAISSGVSTLEWARSLQDAGIAHRLVAGDLGVRAFLVSIGSAVEILVDRTGYPLHVDLLGHGFANTAPRTWQKPAAAALRLAAAGFVRAQPDLRRYLQGSVARFEPRMGIACEPITLVSPRLLQSATIEVVEDDLLVEDPTLRQRFHALRAANILNVTYFDEPALTRMLVNLRSRLRPGGLLIVCRTHEDRSNHGEIFRLEGDGLISIERFGQGSEIGPLVARLRQSTSRTRGATARS